MVKVVMVAGFFDPIHQGHVEHIREAAKLGDYLVVATHSDAVTQKVKGRCLIPLETRLLLLRGLLLALNVQGQVRLAIDVDGRVTKTLKEVLPDIFAKGGDRTPNNMPVEESNMCEEIGCEVRYGLGRLLNSSSRIKAIITDHAGGPG